MYIVECDPLEKEHKAGTPVSQLKTRRITLRADELHGQDLDRVLLVEDAKEGDEEVMVEIQTV